MSLLGDHFAMMLVVETDADAEQLRDALEKELSVAVTIDQLHEYGQRGARDDTHQVTVNTYEDRRGIMHKVSSALADQGINIVEVASSVTQVEGELNCAMCFTVSLPVGVTESQLYETLQGVLDEFEIERTERMITVRPAS
jgi:predicted amino acid-binding ACT domain protein